MSVTTRVTVATVPLRVPFAHAAGVRSTSSSVLVELELDGVVGIGEAAPRPYVTGETVESVRDGLRAWRPPVPDAMREVVARVLTDGVPEELVGGAPPNLRCAIELALVDLAQKGRPVPGADAEIPFVPVLDGNGRWSTGATHLATAPLVKVKTARTLEETAERVRALRDRPRTVIVDANNGWGRADARSAVGRLLHEGATWFEEPTASRDWEALRELRGLGARILLDESCCTEADLDAAVDADAVDAVNVRVAKLGGPSAAARIAARAEAAGFGRYYGVQVGEVGTLIAAGRAVALADPGRMGAESGQADLFFDDDQLWAAPVPVDRVRGVMTVPGALRGRSPQGERETTGVLV